MADTTTRRSAVLSGDEIDLIALAAWTRDFAKAAWGRRRLLQKYAGIGALLGLLWALGSRSEYSSTIKLLPYGPQNPAAGLSGLTGFLGLRSGGGIFDHTVSAYTYPEVVASLDYRLALSDRPLRFSAPDTTLSVYQYLTTVAQASPTQFVKRYTIRLPWTLKNAIGGMLAPRADTAAGNPSDSLLHLSVPRRDVLEDLKSRVAIEVSEETGIVTIVASMPDRLAAAELADESAGLLMERAIAIDSKKAAEELAYVDSRLAESRQRLAAARAALVQFLESNRDLTSARLLLRRQELQEAADLESQVYQQLTAQQSDSRLKKSRDTPVFAVLQHPAVPIERTSPSRTNLVLLGAFLGVLVGLGNLIFRDRLLATA